MRLRFFFLLVLTLALGREGLANPRREITVELPGGAKMAMVWVEPGSFMMGTTEEQEQHLRRKGMWDKWNENEQPAHEVTISQGFYLGKYEITQGQWKAVMGGRPWAGKANVQEDPNHPAVYISWNDLQGFSRRLNSKAGEELYRLPAEAEWEYACRAGTTTLWSFGDDEKQLKNHAWYYDNTWKEGEKYAHAVGKKQPNPWGLYDMHGNVYQWCADWHQRNYYQESPPADPTCETASYHRVIRGGCFDDAPSNCRTTYRSMNDPSDRNHSVGLRVTCITPSSQSPSRRPDSAPR